VTVRASWEAWILYVLAAIDETARWTTGKIRAIRTLSNMTADHVRRRAPKLYSHELVELTFVQPCCRIGNVVGAGIAKRQAASEYLKKLCEIDVLEEMKAGREKLFVNKRLLKLLKADDHKVRGFGAGT